MKKHTQSWFELLCSRKIKDEIIIPLSFTITGPEIVSL